ncbi:MAG TPA: hypothetical protein DET40_18720 [Lentisphaeria bacterium]|nr:MAG: hypothetical protein A2X45_25645 [Lentisphaerae bacterium GWF2_50_93]HCE45579.1 hypothetical protein [Lentisphaeria bacterium]
MSGNAITIRVPTSRTSVIAMRSGKRPDVVAHGTKIKSVVDKARKNGVEDPILMFVPKKGHRYIY